MELHPAFKSWNLQQAINRAANLDIADVAAGFWSNMSNQQKWQPVQQKKGTAEAVLEDILGFSPPRQKKR